MIGKPSEELLQRFEGVETTELWQLLECRAAQELRDAEAKFETAVRCLEKSKGKPTAECREVRARFAASGHDWKGHAGLNNAASALSWLGFATLLPVRLGLVAEDEARRKVQRAKRRFKGAASLVDWWPEAEREREVESRAKRKQEHRRGRHRTMFGQSAAIDLQVRKFCVEAFRVLEGVVRETEPGKLEEVLRNRIRIESNDEQGHLIVSNFAEGRTLMVGLGIGGVVRRITMFHDAGRLLARLPRVKTTSSRARGILRLFLIDALGHDISENRLYRILAQRSPSVPVAPIRRNSPKKKK